MRWGVQVQETITIRVAGEEGLEPSHAGIKIRCLDQLGDSPSAAINAPPSRSSDAAAGIHIDERALHQPP